MNSLYSLQALLYNIIQKFMCVCSRARDGGATKAGYDALYMYLLILHRQVNDILICFEGGLGMDTILWSL